MIKNEKPSDHLSKEKAFTWIHVRTDDIEKMNMLQDEFDLPEYVIESARDTKEVSRLEHWDKELEGIPNLLILKYPQRRKGQLDWDEYITLPIVILVFPDTIITMAQTEVAFLLEAEKGRFRKLEAVDRDYFILTLIWNIGAEYIYCLNEINDRMDLLERQLQKSTETDQLFGLMALQKSLVFFASAIDSNHPVIKNLETIHSFVETDRSRSLLHQALIEIEQAEKTVDETNKLLDQISEVYASAIGNNLNTVVKFLSSVTIILSIPGLIGALWGMNVPVPFTQHPQGFFLVGLISVLLTFASIWYFYKKNFL